MTFKNISTIGFILTVMAFLAPIAVKADVTIDPTHSDRILIGPDKIFDWVEIGCIDHIAAHDVIVHDYCDSSPIVSVEYNSYARRWLITKKHSKWFFEMDNGPQSAIVRLVVKY